MPDIRSSTPVCDIERLVRAAHLHPEDQEEAGRRALGILRCHGLRWSDVLPMRRKSLAGALDFNLDWLDRVHFITCRLDLVPLFDLAALAVMSNRPPIPVDPEAPVVWGSHRRNPGPNDERVLSEIERRHYDLLFAERAAIYAGLGV